MTAQTYAQMQRSEEKFSLETNEEMYNKTKGWKSAPVETHLFTSFLL